MKNVLSKVAATLIAIFSFFIIHNTLLIKPVYAVCPICTVAVGAGLGLSRWLGIDDSISGIWIGGLTLSMSFWLIDWLRKKGYGKRIAYQDIVVVLLMYALVLLPLWWGGLIGHPFNTILGMDKILFGTILGTLAFLFGKQADSKVRQIKGKQLFIFQKVAFPVLSLLMISLIVYYFGGYLVKI